MSKIFAELVKATGLDKTDQKNEGDLKKLILAVGQDLTDKQWAGLSSGAQDWYNEAADAVNDKKAIPAFPDAEKDEEPATPRRRSTAAADDKKATGGPDILRLGQTVKIESKRGRTIEGVVTKLETEGDAFVEVDEKDDMDLDKIATVTVLKDVEQEERSSRRSASKDEPAEPEGPAVGDEVEVVNARGKTFTGTVTELTDDDMTIDVGKGELEDFSLGKVKSVKVLKKAEAEKPAARRGSAKADEKKDEKDGDEKKRSSNPKGVSVGGRIRELMCESPFDLPSTEELGKALKKEGIEFRDTSVNMIFKDTKAVIDNLIENKFLKAPK